MDGNRYYFFMKKTLFKHKQWWRQPHGSVRGMRHQLATILLLIVMVLTPQGAWAVVGSDVSGTGFWWKYFIRQIEYNNNNNGKSPKISFKLAYAYDYTTYVEGYMQAQGGLKIYASKDNGSHWTLLGTISTNKDHGVIFTSSYEGFSTGGTPYTYNDGTIGTTWHQNFNWTLPLAWRNCKIKFKGEGTWCDKDGSSNRHSINSKDITREINATYTFGIRNIYWNTDWSLAPDGTMTIPYSFSTAACNTDGGTYIATKIDGTYNSAISTRNVPSSMSPGSYSFKLSAISKKMTDSFKIQPYHEFCHHNDLSNGGNIWVSELGDTKVFYAFPVAKLQSAYFNQKEKKVTLTWTASNTFYQTGNHGTKWAIYRNGQYYKSILQDETGTSTYRGEEYKTFNNGTFTFYDDDFPYEEKDLKYEVYYIWKEWDERTAKVEDLKSKALTVNTERSVPIKEIQAIPNEEDIEFTWSSTSFPAGWGNKFNIYMISPATGSETLLYTIIPKDNQSKFKWVHRAKNVSRTTTAVETPNDPEYPVVYYTDEPLNACTPHDYRIESVIDDKVLTSHTIEKRAIGAGTLFKSLEASKGSYPGTVKLSWSVDKRGDKSSKEYEIHRRTADRESDPWDYIETLSSTEEHLRYTDATALPGVYYEYRVTVYDKCEDNQEPKSNSSTDIGFAQTTGTISGRITYGTSGTAVDSVEVVMLKANSSDNTESQYHSIHFTSADDYISWAYPDSAYATNKFSAGDFTMQIWLYPEEFKDKWVVRLHDNRALGIHSNRQLLFCDGKRNYEFGLYMNTDKFSQVTVTRSGRTLTCYLIEFDANGKPIVKKSIKSLNEDQADGLDLKNAKEFQLGYFKGFADEFRLWTKCLSETEIIENCDHLLVGNEKGLETYWTFDEGLGTQFFDYSREGTVYHQHHGKMKNNAKSATTTPSNLSLKGITDRDGNYIIQGVPFSGEGTYFNIIPTRNSHEFSPQKQSRFVSSSSLVHNSVDFNDVSSFEVKGSIIYAGTNIPVDSVQIWVDGRPVSRNNEAVVTNEEGEFVIDVPIGKHYITAIKDGHTFVNEGRIPEDPSGLNETLLEFKNPLSGLRFIDTTLVPVGGRVVGGSIEGDKPLGFGLSTNTIGKAVITLEIPDKRYMLNAEEETEGLVSNGFNPVASNTPLTTPDGMTKPGEAYRTGGQLLSDAQHIVITTDAETGEFGVMLPPLDYKVVSVEMENEQARKEFSFNPEQLPRINASDATTVLKDSIQSTDGSYTYFDYVASFMLTKHTTPILDVIQDNATANAFGNRQGFYTIPSTGETKSIDLYTGNGNNVTYTFGYPIFTEMNTYKFLLEGYENYMNYETGIETKVPLKDVVVTISNALSTIQEVQSIDDPDNAGAVLDLKSNQLQLDAEGKATYVWQAGLPNIQGDFTRALNMTYNNGAGEYSWKGLNGIIFGDLPSGTNYSTEGPNDVEMILHDPYGDSSFATWETGKVTINSNETVRTDGTANNFMTNIHLGVDICTGVNAFGVSTQSESDATLDNSHGFDRLEQNDTIGSHTTTLEVTRAISTSAEPEFVGADADIYIGKSNNLLFGRARSVGLKVNVNGIPEVTVDQVITVGKKFETNFVYTQYQIENVIIPNLLVLRNALLTQVSNMEGFKNSTNETMYVTELSPEDEHFGEPKTYKPLYVTKNKDEVVIDMVQHYNSQIEGWKKAIANNEQYKLNTINSVQGRNVSFGGGSEISESESNTTNTSQTTTYTYNYTYNMFFDVGYTWNGLGGDVETTLNQITESSNSNTHEEENTATFSYTLADSGADDSFSMDIFPASGNHSPMFRTLGGQSSCPYEGQEVTKYFVPGSELSAATEQIEQPELACDNNMLTGVPTGGKAQFELKLRNNSITNTDCYFNLIPVDGSNPKGALLSLPTGPIGNGRTVFVPAGETVNMILTLEQGNRDVMKYDDIEIALTSTCDDNISSSVTLNAEFVPASTPVIMAIDKPTVNLNNVEDGLQFRVTGFDRYFTGLQRVDLQYMAPGEHTWSLLKAYIPNENVRTDNSQALLPENGVIELPIDMKASKWADGTYQFRAQSSALFSGKSVTAESDVLTVVKDLKRPQIFGLANPTDGVLNGDDEISITFNEDIQQGMLTKNNIIVSGVLNGAEVAHDVALSAQNTERAAYTQANFNLARKSFSGDVWVRVTDTGDILTHGNGDEKFKLSINADGKLVVTIGNHSYTSVKTIEKNNWTFLSFSYNYDAGSSHLNACAVTADDTKTLFDNEAVTDYNGTGSITLGQNFTGAMHELTLWDKGRTMQEARAEMYLTKKPSTPNLIGYWKMDEGNGIEIRDYARNRHLTMPNSTWYLNNDNKAVALNGTDDLKLNIAACNAQPTEDYAVEMWFKGEKANQKDEATLFSANSESVGIGFTGNGGLSLKANGTETELSNSNVLDNAWHHVALNVLRNGNATAYIDGKAVKTLSASVVPSLQGSWLYIGSEQGKTGTFFKGMVDEIRIWNASLTGELINSQRTQRLNGDESGLSAYYSFEKLTRDPNSGLITSVSNAKDLCTGSIEADSESGYINFTNEAPALKVKPEATNVEFNYVSNERGIIITLNETPARLEGTTLQFTVKGIQDLNGNESTPVKWTAFVRQNSLLWKGDSEITLQKQVGELATFEATFTNESGTAENWTLSGLPAWLTANATSGTLKAQLSKTITFTVAETVPTGKYEETIYLTGNNNISEPLTLSLKVTGKVPDWNVNPKDYQFSMNVIGRVEIQGTPMDDEDDIIAAFIGEECRGVAHPEYKQRYDGYYVTMDIYGDDNNQNKKDTGKEVTFRFYDASTGTLYPVVEPDKAINFKPLTLVGKYNEPVVFDVKDMIEQSTDLKTGWNWLSLYVKTGDAMTVNDVFEKITDDVVAVKSQTKWVMKNANGEWSGELTNIANNQMYAVQMKADRKLRIVGKPVNPAECQVDVQKGWNWIGYYGQQVASVSDALAGVDPEDGDILKGQSGVAYFDNYEWAGSLAIMEPGVGYMLKSVTDDERWFSYPAATVAATRGYIPVANAKRLAPAKKEASSKLSVFTPVNFRDYANNAIMTVKLMACGNPVGQTELGVFADDECRTAALSDSEGMAYLTIPGDDDATLTFKVFIGEEIFESPKTINYEVDGIFGTPDNPIIIDLDNATLINSIGNSQAGDSQSVYDLSGRRMPNSKLRRGVYIIDGQKKSVR